MKTKLIFIMLLYSICFFSQDMNEFSLVLQEGRYKEKTINRIANVINTKKYYFIGKYYIDRKNEGIINLKDLEVGLNRIVPKDTEGFLVLDLENKLYHDLKKDTTSTLFKKAEVAFIDMIKYVKKHRPKIKISVYGIPFTTYWDKVKTKKYYKIVSNLDFISPHLYIYYPNEQFKKEKNILYLKKNLSLFLDYKKKLGVEVYPFIWYKIHPSNKKYKGKILSSNEINDILKVIRNENYEACKVNGVLWWEPMLRKPFDIDGKLISTFIIN
ncbi:hypothetical protein [Tenacibaculum larymnensis]|uniref:Uncharacterized protein n=1 Tax=Tenacibaculum larymnensis TaxID=2878201 RepID=A0A9X4IMU7_9FLAO|nr:hypothetical protein [Tenacibaculum larymnensis]MDE1208104.1 hypothetical protein [Tenacibaculum larymnensis]